MTHIGIVIADGQRLVRAGLSLILQAQTDMRVLGEGETLADAVRLVDRHRPDIVCLATSFADGDGFLATRRIRGLGGEQPSVVVLVGSRDGDLSEQVREAGADRTLGKYASPEQIVAELRHAAAMPRTAARGE